MIRLYLLGAFLLGCATAPMPADIARNLDGCLRFREKDPLSWRCECVTWAEQTCSIAGFDRRCFADGWVDADHDGWTVAACREKRP